MNCRCDHCGHYHYGRGIPRALAGINTRSAPALSQKCIDSESVNLLLAGLAAHQKEPGSAKTGRALQKDALIAALAILYLKSNPVVFEVRLPVSSAAETSMLLVAA